MSIRSDGWIRRPTAGILLVLLAMADGGARAQEAPAAAAADEWRLLESAPETLDYKARLKEGVFDDASKKFLVDTALPQLKLPKNRATIDRVRRRMRDVLCSETSSDQKAVAAATQTVAEFMTAVARDGKADPVVRVNAMLLVGELTAAGKKPWTPAVPPLVAAIGDAALPPAVRIAAAAGLARHVEADAVARSADVGPGLVALVGGPLAGVDPLAADWLRARALSMLAQMGGSAPPNTAATAATVLRDANRPLDVRVRAAATVGRTVKAPGDTDVAATVAAIRDLATTALAATQAETDRRALVTRLSGRANEPPPASPPGSDAGAGPAARGILRYRRDAWRLATLADALMPADGKGGLATVAGATAPAVTALADALRTGAQALDARPGAEALAAASAAIAAAGEERPAATPAAPAAAEPAVERAPF